VNWRGEVTQTERHTSLKDERPRSFPISRQLSGVGFAGGSQLGLPPVRSSHTALPPRAPTFLSPSRNY